MANHCLNTSKYIFEYCQKNNIRCRFIEIEPGYINHSRLYEGFGCHCFCIITVNNKKYIVDCTYSQFFHLGNNLIERMGIPKIPSPKVGAYMVMEEKRKKLAEKILRDGYIELNKENLKNYLDGFTLFFRNGLYYEETDDFSYTTVYTSEDYKNFLNGKDYQTAYEDASRLGYMPRALKKPQMDFSKR